MTSHKEPDRRQLTGSPKKAVLKVAGWALAGGLVAFFILDWAFHGSGLELLKVVLTMIAGFGGTVYLVVRYRTQVLTESDDWRKEQEAIYKAQEARRDEEQFIEDKLFRAIEMLGAEAVSTKIAGVYALTDVSDTYGGRYKQRVVDILCGYLRTQRSEAELPVEVMIIDLIHDRTFALTQFVKINDHDDNRYWSECIFNLSGAVFRSTFDISGCNFKSVVDLSRCEFKEDFVVRDAFIDKGLYIQKSLFRKNVYIEGVTRRGLYLEDAVFFSTENKRIEILNSILRWSESHAPFFESTYNVEVSKFKLDPIRWDDDYAIPYGQDGYTLIPDDGLKEDPHHSEEQ